MTDPPQPDDEASELLDAVLGAPEVAQLAAETPNLDSVVRRFYFHTAAEDLAGRGPLQLVATVTDQLTRAGRRSVGETLVFITNPSPASAGSPDKHTVVSIITDDMPFVVDSVTAALNQMGRRINLVVHPVFVVQRDQDGKLIEPVAGDDGTEESWLYVEIDRELDPAVIDEMTKTLREIMADVRAAVEDWAPMMSRARELAQELTESSPLSISATGAAEAAALLRWLANGRFTFLGYREYQLVRNDQSGDSLVSLPQTGLGLLRSDRAHTRQLSAVRPQVQAKAREQRPLVLTKANRRSTVHRPGYLDYVGVKKFDAEGRVTGERRFIGLLTSSAYTESAMNVPVIRHTISQVQESSGYPPTSHNARDLDRFCETYPRDELFQVRPDQLLNVAKDVLSIAERRQTRIYLRTDDYGRFVSVLVYLPRDRFTTSVRLEMMRILGQQFGSTAVDFAAQVSESVLARLHFVVRMASGVPVPEVDVPELAAMIQAVTRTWDDDFSEALLGELGEDRAAELIRRYAGGIPESYKEYVEATAAVDDFARLDELDSPGRCAVNLHDSTLAASDEHRLTLYQLGDAVDLFEILPILSSLGAQVLEERPFGITRSDGLQTWIYEVSLRLPNATSSNLASDGVSADRFCEAFLATWRGDCEVDGLNQLVALAGLDWREVAWLRAYVQHARQLGSPFSFAYFFAVITQNHQTARMLVDLFRARLDPTIDPSMRSVAVMQIEADIASSIDAVQSLDGDRILRTLFGQIQATLRTNAFQRGPEGGHRAAFAIKLAGSQVPGVPHPVPLYEIWVCSPRVSGVHLRFGPVARGGLRWSDRPEDMRTEILGLVKAQTVKNAVIVPVGAKGGFLVKRPRDPRDRMLWLEDGIASYRELITSMLEVTDNIVAGQVVGPAETVRVDGDDPYLVVAADKGTAAFSDIANEIAVDHGFWLGDAFASGGSVGYDHKEMGITARGAWESVKRHFRELGIDIQTEPVTMVGVGDMSGDVFGNGALLSHELKLVGAFDHRHVFVDPDPNPEVSFGERARLASLGRSSWADYSPGLISAGGGVYERSLKAIPITDQVRTVLGLPPSTKAMTPDELIRALLLAPVDLLFNGGIGTYVKAATESNLDAGDKANDSVRVDGCQLRCRVIGEGGNLGLTQPGRVEAARNGVRLNTDAIDNSAGVDCSDHEVNIKIFLDSLVDQRKLELAERNELLAQMTADVSALVLTDNYRQNVLLGNARAQASRLLPVHRRVITSLVERGLLDRDLEHLPTDAALARLQAEGEGLCSPELAVLLSYVKIALTADLANSELAREPWFGAVLRSYFPRVLVERFGVEMDSHRLRSEIITTLVANDMVDHGGVSFVHRAVEETGATSVDVARAYIAAREVFGLPELWRRIDDLDGTIPTAGQTAMFLEIRRLLDRATRWFLSRRGGKLDVVGEVTRLRSSVAEFDGVVARLLVGSERTRMVARSEQMIDLGAPRDLALDVAASLDRFSLLDIDDIARRYDAASTSTAEVYFAVSEHFGIDALLRRISQLPQGDRWANLARAALRSDLYSVLAGLTSKVLRSTSAEEVAEGRIAQWEARNADGQQRAWQTMSEIEKSGTYDLTTLSVALRVLRTLVQQGDGITAEAS